MKPKLHKLLGILAASTAITPTVHADYTGGQIVNQDNNYTGDINITYNVDQEHAVDAESNEIRNGGVGIMGTEGSGMSTVLEGNINITAGQDYASYDPHRLNDGVLIDYYAENSEVTLKTAGAGDRIVINLYAKGAGGVINMSSTSKVTLDASRSGSPIEIHSHNATTETTAGCHLVYSRGVVEILGDLRASSQANLSRGIGADRGGSLKLSGNYDFTSYGANAHGINVSAASSVDVGGDVSISANGQDSRGITVGGGSTVTVEGTADINTRGIGINAGGAGSVVTLKGAGTVASMDGVGLNVSTGGRIVAEKHVTVSTGAGAGKYGIFSGGTDGVNASSVSLNGATVQTQNGQGMAIVAYTGVINAAAAKYDISGSIYAAVGGEINMTMTENSSLKGAVDFKNPNNMGNSTGTINLSLLGNSLWNVTESSKLTSLTLDGTSWLAFNLVDGGAMTFTNITATSIALAEGAVLQLMGVSSADFEGTARALNTFTANLLNAGTLTADGVKLVTEDNYELAYTNNNDGTFTVTGLTNEQLFIPEPATATLGLLGMASLMLRRRRR